MRYGRLLLLLFFAGVVLLSACDRDGDGGGTTDERSSSADSTETTPQESQSSVSSDSQQQEVQSSDDSASQQENQSSSDSESSDESSAELLQNAEFVRHESPSNIIFEYPESWLIEDEPDSTILLETSSGFSRAIPIESGAFFMIVPRDAQDFEGDNATAKLMFALSLYGLPGDSQSRNPKGSAENGQQVAVSEFTSVVDEIEGLVAVVLKDTQMLFVIAAASGENRFADFDNLTQIMDSIELVGAG